MQANSRRIILPAVMFAILLGAAQLHAEVPLARLTGVQPHLAWLILAIGGWLSGAWLVVRLMAALVWSRVGRSTGRHAPALLIQLTNVIIYLVSALSMAASVFEVSLTGAVATSSVIGLVVGFAVKSLISDTFSGIALNLDSGFSIGDFIEVQDRGKGGSLTGQVTQVNWRSTYLLTPAGSVLVLPNTLMSESVVLNLSKPDAVSEYDIIITLDFEVAVDRAIRVLTAAVEAASAENPAIFDCHVRVEDTNINGVDYRIKYTFNPGTLPPGKENRRVRAQILRHVLRHLKLTGLSIAHPKLDNWQRAGGAFDEELGDASHRRRLLRNVDLFRALTDDELFDLAARMTQRTYQPGARIIKTGEPGQSMFVMSEGLVTVRIKTQESEVDVATLSPGDFFGEMSLLTGEPRSAAIVAVTDAVAFEIDKADIEPLLDSNPEAAEMLSLAVAERRLASDAARSAKPPEEQAADRASLAGKIFASMSKFFGKRETKPALLKTARN